MIPKSTPKRPRSTRAHQFRAKTMTKIHLLSSCQYLRVGSTRLRQSRRACPRTTVSDQKCRRNQPLIRSHHCVTTPPWWVRSALVAGWVASWRSWDSSWTTSWSIWSTSCRWSLGNHLTVEPQLQPCELQVDQGLCGVVLFQRPPRQPDGIAGAGQRSVLFSEADIDAADQRQCECLRGLLGLIVLQGLGHPGQLPFDRVEIGNGFCGDPFRLDNRDTGDLHRVTPIGEDGANVWVCSIPS